MRQSVVVASRPLALALLAPDFTDVYKTVALDPFRGAGVVLVVSDVLYKD